MNGATYDPTTDWLSNALSSLGNAEYLEELVQRASMMNLSNAIHDTTVSLSTLSNAVCAMNLTDLLWVSNQCGTVSNMAGTAAAEANWASNAVANANAVQTFSSFMAPQTFTSAGADFTDPALTDLSNTAYHAASGVASLNVTAATLLSIASCNSVALTGLSNWTVGLSHDLSNAAYPASVQSAWSSNAVGQIRDLTTTAGAAALASRRDATYASNTAAATSNRAYVAFNTAAAIATAVAFASNASSTTIEAASTSVAAADRASNLAARAAVTSEYASNAAASSFRLSYFASNTSTIANVGASMALAIAGEASNAAYALSATAATALAAATYASNAVAAGSSGSSGSVVEAQSWASNTASYASNSAAMANAMAISAAGIANSASASAIYASNVGNNNNTANTYASNAARFASNAATHASNAIASTSNAATYASNATIYASNASRYASNVVIYASNAAAYASNSASAATSNGTVYASNAAAYASNLASFIGNAQVAVSPWTAVSNIAYMAPSITRVGINTQAPQQALHVASATPDVALFETASSTLTFRQAWQAFDVAVGTSGTGAVPSLGITAFDGSNANLYVNGQVIAASFVSTSDRRLKDRIAPIDAEEATAALAALEPVRFVYREDEEERETYGFIAQDVQRVLPDVVFPVKASPSQRETLSKTNDGNDEEDIVWTMDHAQLLPMLVKGYAHLSARLLALEKRPDKPKAAPKKKL